MSQNRFVEGKPIAETKVVVAMSGGVDSSTVAAMLHDEGYEVVGVTLQLYDQGEMLARKGACCAGQDIYDAQEVARTRGFAHYVLDYESLFKESVIEDFADSYIRGETPIPCVRCNQSVKFRDLFKVAKDLGADALCTGHYVQRKDGEAGAELHCAVDPKKDQSYFLFATTQEQLDYLHFPLGGLTKVQTRELAKRYGLEIADKPDSQDICFVPDGNYSKIVERMRPGALEEGDIVHVDGAVMGRHKGIINYTIGQRKGLGLGWHEPLYVVKLEPKTHRVIVGPESALDATTFRIKDINWLTNDNWNDLEAGVKIRYSQTSVPATIRKVAGDPHAAEVTMHQPERAITPGQACVVYDGNRVLGGGVDC